MASLKPTIPLERELGKQIYAALQGAVVETILKTAKDESSDDYWRSRMEGHCMRVDKDILPEFHALCEDVKKTLKFKEPVDFYVTGDSSLNAFSIVAGVFPRFMILAFRPMISISAQIVYRSSTSIPFSGSRSVMTSVSAPSPRADGRPVSSGLPLMISCPAY